MRHRTWCTCGLRRDLDAGKRQAGHGVYVPPAGQRAFERARFSEKAGDHTGAAMNYDEAAETGHPMVLLAEARFYLRGPEGRDPAKAKEALERAILVPSEWQGDAQFLLGKMLVRGDGVPVELERGQQLLQLATENGTLGAPAELARSLERNGSTDTARIDALWMTAADRGDEQAIVRVAERALASGKKREELPEVTSRAMTALIQRAEEGDANAMRSLAKIYSEGTLAPQDKELAVAWLERAANAGDAQSATRLATVTRGTGRDEERISWLTKGAEAGDPRAAGGLAQAYLDGEGVQADPQKAEKGVGSSRHRRRRQCDHGSLRPGLCRGQGRSKGRPARTEDAGDFSCTRRQPGCSRTSRVSIFVVRTCRPSGARGYYAEAALQAGDELIKTPYGRALLEGKAVPADPKRGIELLSEAAAQGDPLASTQLGIAYLDGNGVGKDLDKAVPLLRVGAEAGNASAMNRLAQVMLSGDPTYGHEASGIAMLEKAAEAGHPPPRQN